MAHEISVKDSQPEELYDFVYSADSSHYTITSAAYNVTFSGAEYLTETVSRDKIKRTGEIGKNGLKVLVDRDNDYFNRMILGALTHQTTLLLYSLQPDGSYAKIWTGTIKAVLRTPDNIEVSLNPISSSASRPIVHRKYQVQCPLALFSHYCGVDELTFTRSGTVTSIAGTVLQADIFATEVDGWFVGGTITIGNEKKTIIKHIGTSVTLLDAFYGIIVGSSFDATAGCGHDIQTSCRDKFANELNYGGCPWIPSADNLTMGRPFTY